MVSYNSLQHCNSLEFIKYICKYFNKGSDQAAFHSLKSGQSDEVKDIKWYNVKKKDNFMEIVLSNETPMQFNFLLENFK